jgi:hypothetical protein
MITQPTCFGLTAPTQQTAPSLVPLAVLAQPLLVSQPQLKPRAQMPMLSTPISALVPSTAHSVEQPLDHLPRQARLVLLPLKLPAAHQRQAPLLRQLELALPLTGLNVVAKDGLVQPLVSAPMFARSPTHGTHSACKFMSRA